MYLHMHTALVTIANAQLLSPLLKELTWLLLVLEGDLGFRVGSWKGGGGGVLTTGSIGV